MIQDNVVFMVINIHVMIWVVMPCSDVVGYQRFWGLPTYILRMKDGSSMVLQSVRILLYHYTALQSKRPWLGKWRMN